MGKESRLSYTFIPPAVFTFFLTAFYLSYKILPGPELLFLCLFVYASYKGNGNRFLRTFSPFIISFLSYESLNRLIDSVPRFIHVQEPIAADLWIFNSLPTVMLQQNYRMPVLDYIGAAFYSAHLFAPTIFAFLLWRFHSEYYQKYTLAFMICTYSALITFFVYPVAPPWYGVGATRILFQVDHKLGVPVYKAIYDYIGVNPFAAFPSLHSAFPWIIALFTIKAWRKKALPILIFPFMVWFSAVYLGEHYVIDIVGGVLYATLAFILACNKEKIKGISTFNIDVISPILDRLGEAKLPVYREADTSPLRIFDASYVRRILY